MGPFFVVRMKDESFQWAWKVAHKNQGLIYVPENLKADQAESVIYLDAAAWSAAAEDLDLRESLPAVTEAGHPPSGHVNIQEFESKHGSQ
jgi:hypothetical protein